MFTVHVFFQNVKLQKEVCEELTKRKFAVSTDRIGVKMSEDDILLTDDGEDLIFIEQICTPAKAGYISSKSADIESVLRIFSLLVQNV